MTWQQLTIVAQANQAEALADALHELGALSVSLQDAADEELFQLQPDETPLWQQTKITALFADDIDLTQVITELKNTLAFTFTSKVNKVKDRDWVHETQKNFPPQCFGNKLWVIPSWHQPANKNDVVVRIDPGLAFGTGTHPTTALCLTWLAQHPPQHIKVIDYGCGSGILALACLALGANTVWATDHDSQALIATSNNAQLNNFATTHNLIITEHVDHQAPLIIANILANPLIELAPVIKSLVEPKATLILSGLLIEDIDRVSAAYAPEFTVQDQQTQDRWVLLVLSS